MNDSSFIYKNETYKILSELFEQRKEWFIQSLSTAVESVTSDEFVYQLFQNSSSKLYIPDRLCEIVSTTITDDREVYINQLLQFLKERLNNSEVEHDQLERIGSKLLNLSTKQIEIENDQRNRIKRLTISSKNLKKISKKLIQLNSINSEVGQQMRAFKRRLPIFLDKFKDLLNSYLFNYLSKYKIALNDLIIKNKSLSSENSRLIELNEKTTEKVTLLQETIKKCQIKYQKLKDEKSKNDALFESYLKQLQLTRNVIEISKSDNIKILKETNREILK